MTPRVSLTVTNFSWPGGPAAMPCELERLARRADEGGLDTLWVSDHLLQGEPGTEPTQEMLEAYGTLSFLAATTSRIRLGTLVTANTFRPPALRPDREDGEHPARAHRDAGGVRPVRDAGRVRHRPRRHPHRRAVDDRRGQQARGGEPGTRRGLSPTAVLSP